MKRIYFLDVEIIKEGNQLLTDVLPNPLTPSVPSCNLLSCIPLKKIHTVQSASSENQFFDKRYNDLEVWLKNRGYNEKLVRQQILKARKYRRMEILHGQRGEVHKNNLVFNIIYYPISSKLKKILKFIFF